MGQNRATAGCARQCSEKSAGNIPVTPGIFPEGRWIDLQLNEMLHRSEAITEQEAGAFQGAKQVADHRKGATLDQRKVQSGAANFIDAALDLGHLKVGIDFDIDANQLATAFEVGDTIPQGAIAHFSSVRWKITRNVAYHPGAFYWE